jgi:amylosucrase
MHETVKSVEGFVFPKVRAGSDFLRRLAQHGPRLRQLLAQIYGSRSDFDAWFEKLIAAAAAAHGERPDWLRALDAEREKTPDWFCGNDMLGGVCYVDLYAGNLAGIRKRLPYFKKLGLTYLHLMPLFKAPEHESDGGYAVSSYREVNPALGSMRQFSALMKTMHEQGMATCVDFIFNLYR